jgi:hypothetical protein
MAEDSSLLVSKRILPLLFLLFISKIRILVFAQEVLSLTLKVIKIASYKRKDMTLSVPAAALLT